MVRHCRRTLSRLDVCKTPLQSLGVVLADVQLRP